MHLKDQDFEPKQTKKKLELTYYHISDLKCTKIFLTKFTGKCFIQ